MEIGSTERLAAMLLVAGATQSALVRTLVRKGVISPDEARETYDSALLEIEQMRGSNAISEATFDLARKSMEAQLRKNPRK